MLDPDSAWKSFAIGRYRTGDTIRTDKFRFSEYSTARGEVNGAMLYDHRTDPNENVNILSAVERDPVVAKLRADLRGNKGK